MKTASQANCLGFQSGQWVVGCDRSQIYTHTHSRFTTSGCLKKHSCIFVSNCIQWWKRWTWTSDSVFLLKGLPSDCGDWQPTVNTEASGSVLVCVQEFCRAVNTLLVPEQICFPDWEKLQDMAAYFEDRWGLLHCVGAIGGSHIPIIAPCVYHCDFFNRKEYSVILQGVMDGKGFFWNVQ